MGARPTVIANVTRFDINEYSCSDRGLLLPFVSEYTWPDWLRAIGYFLALLYLFLAIAKIADIFMVAIEQITSQKRKIKYEDSEGNEQFYEKKVWNDTVANLTLMALGSSCPEILLAIIEIVGNKFVAGDLGPGTIVGSAAYNLLIISGLCVIAIPSPNILRIENFSVFLMTTFWSVFAYVWLFLVLAVISPNRVDLWEAILTLLFFFALITLSYLTEKKFFLKKVNADEETEDDISETNLPEDFDTRAFKKFIKYLNQYEDLTSVEKEKLIEKYLSPTVPNSRIFARIKAARMLTGSNSGIYSMRSELLEIYNEIMTQVENDTSERSPSIKRRLSITKDEFSTYVEFSSSIYKIHKSEKKIALTITRTGNMIGEFSVMVNSKDCTALSEKDFEPIDYLLIKFQSDETQKVITINLLNPNDEESAGKMFFVNVAIPEQYKNFVKAGKNENCMVMFTKNLAAGEIEFTQPLLNVYENEKEASVKIVRRHGSAGKVSVTASTFNLTATDRVDFIGFKDKEIVFEEGEVEKVLKIPIKDDKFKEDTEEFEVKLINPQGGAKLGNNHKVVVAILDNDELDTKFREAMRKLGINPDRISAEKLSWIDQFRKAACVNEGDVDNATVFDYVMHVISFPWKILFAFVPPPGILGGWLCFFVSLVVIGVLTALVGDVASIFGCLISLKDSITAISFVAMGTSLPDTFASFISAQNEKTADNAIGNVTGSNSVNVFLGLGLPWVVAAIYWQAKGLPFTVPAGDLAFSVVIFAIVCTLCLTVIFLRRYLDIFGKGELGGPLIPKLATGIFFALLWVLYIVLSALYSYGFIKF